MGFKEVIGEKPDLVLSGVNRGQNIADDVTYSGTIAAAMEGTLLQIPSIALSQAYGFDTRDRPHWNTARVSSLTGSCKSEISWTACVVGWPLK